MTFYIFIWLSGLAIGFGLGEGFTSKKRWRASIEAEAQDGEHFIG